MEIQSEGKMQVAIIPARLDMVTSKEAEAALAQAMEGDGGTILCDFSACDYISSSGLRVLLATAKEMKRRGGRLVLCGFKPYVHDVFDSAGFLPLFERFDSKEEAMTALSD